MTAGAELAHATVAAHYATGVGWRGVLIMGPSGAGKSDLALRLISAAQPGGWRLVADDYAHVWCSQGVLYARAPDAIAGRMEVRGLGLVDRPFLSMTRVVLAVQCVRQAPERLPEADFLLLAGVRTPRVEIEALHPSAPARLSAALEALGQARPLDY